MLFDAPPTIGHNIQRAVDEIAAAHGVTNKVTHLIYSHHHADHAGASSLFDRYITRIGHEETRRLLLRDDDPARPAPDETFQDRRTLEIGGERIELAWHGSNHSPDNIFIHLPDHAALMLVDIVNPGWAAICQSNLADDVPGYIDAADHRPHLPMEALHRRPYGWARDTPRHRNAPTVPGRHRGQLPEGAGHLRSRSVFDTARREQLGRHEGLSGHGHGCGRGAGHQEVLGHPCGRGTLHCRYHVPRHAIDRLDLGYATQVHP